MYLHRFLRLTPLLSASILMTILARFMGSGPFWPFTGRYIKLIQLIHPIFTFFISNCIFTVDHLVGTCGRYWWSTLFYVQNYANQDALCYPHTWYLSADMQLFVISPFVIYLIHRYKMKTIIGLLVAILGCMGYKFIIHQIYNITHLYVSITQSEYNTP